MLIKPIAELMGIRQSSVDQVLLCSGRDLEGLIGENGQLKQLIKLLVEKTRGALMAAHLGGKHESVVNAAGNPRKGKSRKTPGGEFGELPIEASRNRHGSFRATVFLQAPDQLVGSTTSLFRSAPGA